MSIGRKKSDEEAKKRQSKGIEGRTTIIAISEFEIP
jgi:hypothetical protein